MVLDIFCFFIFIFATWGMLGGGCEYRNYKGGHRFIKAFRARGTFQKSLTLLQGRNNVHPDDMGKLTYIGFIGAVISFVLAIIVLPYTIYAYFFLCREIALYVFMRWVYIGGTWGIASLILQGIDSILNRILP